MKEKIIIIYLIIINIVTLILYITDKRRAQKNKWRIKENTLIAMAALGGSIGAFLGMYGFRHKTKHPKFYIGVPLIFLLQVGLVTYWYLNLQ